MCNSTIDLRKQKCIKSVLVQISPIVHGSLGHEKYEHLVTFPESTTFTHTIICSPQAFGECFALINEAGYSVVFKNNYPKYYHGIKTTIAEVKAIENGEEWDGKLLDIK